MAKSKKQEEEIKTDGWKDTFSDLMNLLLCFFVLLFSMSSVDEVKYAELIASLANSFSIFSGGAQALGDGMLISSGASQLNNLDQYFSDMGKAAESDSEEDPTKENQQQQAAQREKTEQLYEDVVEQAEQKKIADAIDVSIDASSQYVMISLSGDLLFESGKADIPAGAVKVLDRVGDILKVYSGKLIKIEGHTDNVPIKSSTFPSNLWLSTARATKVYEYFTSVKKLKEKNLEASGRGEAVPVADNNTAQGRARNRRVEIKIYSNTN